MTPLYAEYTWMEPIYLYALTHSPVVYAVVLFFFGAAVGSFLNVVICRVPYELSLLSPPSSCPKCGRRIFGLDNLPVLSWLLLKGRCRQCKVRIPLRYPGVELLTAGLWATIGYVYALQEIALPMSDAVLYQRAGLLVLHLVFVSMLIAITFIDFDHQIIPDELSLGGVALALFASCLLPGLHLVDGVALRFPAMPWLDSVLSACLGAAAGGGLVLFLSLAGTIFFRKQIKKAQETDPEINTAIGLGDVKLMAFVGAVLGWKAVLAAFFVGTCVGAVAGSVVKIWSGSWPPPESKEAKEGGFAALLYRWQTGESIIPFGPFLAIGSLILFFFREPILTWFAVYVFHMTPVQ